jgi:flagellar biosynthesis/type III secretory pathway protein FliH
VDRQKKYLDFVDIYAALDENERAQYAREYPEEAEAMSRFADRFREEGVRQGLQQGLQQGRQEGLQQGEAVLLLRLLHRKFGELPDAVRERVAAADPDTLLTWSERILTAQSIDDVVH